MTSILPRLKRKLRLWLSHKFANAAIRVAPTGANYRRKMGVIYHIGPGKRCPNDPDWMSEP